MRTVSELIGGNGGEPDRDPSLKNVQGDLERLRVGAIASTSASTDPADGRQDPPLGAAKQPPSVRALAPPTVSDSTT